MPLGGWIEECESIPSVKVSVVRNTNFEAAHVENQAGVAGMVAVHQIRIEFDARIQTPGNGGIGRSFSWRGRRDFGE